MNINLNHILIRTPDLGAMHRFWTAVIGLEQTPRPPFPFPGEWLGTGDRALVHLVEDARRMPGAGPIAHVALEGANYQTLMENLNNRGVHYVEKDVPGSGERQVFVAGPDGLTVEMLFPCGVATDSRPYADDHAHEVFTR